jgi:hypothetical protein
MHSEWGLRQAAENQGVPVSHQQFQSYRRWGLIPEPSEDRGRWPQSVVERLIKIRCLHDEVRPLPRRVLRLRSEPEFADIPAEHLRDAMLAVLPTITAPVRKLRWIDDAVHALPGFGGRRHARAGRPRRTEWETLLRTADLDVLVNRMAGHVHLLASLNEYGKGTAHDLRDIPLEEQIVLLTIRDVAQIQAAQDRYERQDETGVQSIS